MKCKILIKKVKAYDVNGAMRIIKKKYPRSKMVTYKFDKDFKYVPKEERDYKNRIISVVFVDDVRRCWK